MAQRPFRFGVVAARAASGDAWITRARHVEQLGYAVLLMPDRLSRVLSPLPALAVAAAATRSLRLGTFVLANGLRNPAILARECATLDFLSHGRFELGLGTGVADEDFRLASVPFDRPGARIDRLAETLRVVKAFFDGDADKLGSTADSARQVPRYPAPVQQPWPPFLIAGAGPRLLALAAREADIVAFGVSAQTSEVDLAEKIALVRQSAGERASTLELSLNLLAVVGEAVVPGVPERIRAMHRVELKQLVAARSPLVVAGTPDEMAEQLRERRARLGVSYVTIPDDQVEAFAPVVERLAGR